MGKLTQKKNSDESNSSRTYDTAEIRHLSIEEQTRYRKDKVDMRLRLRKTEGMTAPAATKIVGIPERTLYSWQKKPVPESTRIMQGLVWKLNNEIVIKISFTKKYMGNFQRSIFYRF